MSITAILAPFQHKSAEGFTSFPDPTEAYDYLCLLYDRETSRLREAFTAFVEADDYEGLNGTKIKGFYPSIRVEVGEEQLNLDRRLSHGNFKEEGIYEINVSDPRQYHDLLGQLKKLAGNTKNIRFQVGLSEQEIPLHYAMRDLEFNIDGMAGSAEKADLARRVFTRRKSVENYDYAAKKHPEPANTKLLYGYGPSRFDHAVNQFFYYTRTPWEALQPFVIFSNYAQYVEGISEYGREQLALEFSAASNPKAGKSNVIAVVRTGHNPIIREGFEDNQDLITISKAVERASTKDPQMPACHVITADGLGISMINSGVGDANCRNIASLIAPKRSHAWVMAGHCAGLDPAMQIGDYVSATQFYMNVRDVEMEQVRYVPSAEMQTATLTTMKRLEKRDGNFDRSVMHRRSAVVSTNNRNWENDPRFIEALDDTLAAALEMETAFLADEARKHSIPVAAFLRVSDMPLDDKPKTAKAADDFFGSSVGQHLGIIIDSCVEAKASHLEKLHSRQARPRRGAFVFQ